MRGAGSGEAQGLRDGFLEDRKAEEGGVISAEDRVCRQPRPVLNPKQTAWGAGHKGPLSSGLAKLALGRCPAPARVPASLLPVPDSCVHTWAWVAVHSAGKRTLDPGLPLPSQNEGGLQGEPESILREEQPGVSGAPMHVPKGRRTSQLTIPRRALSRQPQPVHPEQHHTGSKAES